MLGGGGVGGGGGGGAVAGEVGAVSPKAGVVSGLSVTPPKVAASRVSALSSGESVQELNVSSIGVGRATMVVNIAGRRTRR